MTAIFRKASPAESSAPTTTLGEHRERAWEVREQLGEHRECLGEHSAHSGEHPEHARALRKQLGSTGNASGSIRNASGTTGNASGTTGTPRERAVAAEPQPGVTVHFHDKSRQRRGPRIRR